MEPHGNKRGYLRIYGQNTGYGQIQTPNSTSNYTYTTPSVSGTFVVKQSATISTETNGWYKVNMGAYTQYFKHATISNKTFAGNSWGWMDNLLLPSGVTFNSAKMFANANAVASDPAIRLNIAVSSNNTGFAFSWSNSYGQSVTTNVIYDLSLVVFP